MPWPPSNAPEHDTQPAPRPPAPRRTAVQMNSPTGCVYYLLLLTWCVAAAIRHSGGGQAGASWRTTSGIMFAVGVGLLVTGLWTLTTPPRDRLQGWWITIIGGLAIGGAIWGVW
jgi:protein-S-isoprenylcysteine O-methyltransferase Ste14